MAFRIAVAFALGLMPSGVALAWAPLQVMSGVTFAWTPPQAPSTLPAPTAAPGPAPAAVPGPTSPPAPATEAPSVPPEATPATAATAAALLTAADASVDAGNLETARRLFDRVVREYPDSPEASQARRASKIIVAREQRTPPPASQPGPGGVTGDAEASTAGGPGEQIIVRQEPYSTRTAERLRLTSWEKLDFGVTSFLYGMSVGFSFALGSDPNDDESVTLPIALGALAYTLGAVAYLNTANPDRGDLPLALAITSYVPTTTLLVANLAYDNPDEEKTALAVAGAGLLSIPIAIAASHKLNLDPGDTQLVRDAGFWGVLLGTFGTLGFGGETTGTGIPGDTYRYYQSPSARKVAGMGMLGLYGGLGLGALAASHSEISLERVRVTTWGGYGGGILGALIGGGAANSELGAYRGLTVGALLGLVVTFASTSGLDGIPPADARSPRASARLLTPTVLSVPGADGKPLPTFGLAGALP